LCYTCKKSGGASNRNLITNDGRVFKTRYGPSMRTSIEPRTLSQVSSPVTGPHQLLTQKGFYCCLGQPRTDDLLCIGQTISPTNLRDNKKGSPVRVSPW